ncbi:pyridine nucleotide-disulfide oxidoreductase family protein [Clavulina sp. PMI_390]|nr:pyridine nucleotide-disulfide oxidoreductase family protein [Clavulina sp. PMI_390]
MNRAFYTFDTPIGHGEGLLRLLHDIPSTDFTTNTNENAAWKILSFSLTLSSLRNHPELARDLRPRGIESGVRTTSRSWFDVREEEMEFLQDDPQVIIVGAAQCGLMLAARLKRLGVRTLLVEKTARLGDIWRQRYQTLTINSYIWSDHFPYLKFPDCWPISAPKDRMAGWLESYANIMDLRVWLGSTVEPDSTSYDEATGLYTLKIRRGDGSLRELKTQHIVLATGTAGEPNIPTFKSTENFQGVLMHSSRYQNCPEWKGKKAVVVGGGNSGHDICQEFYNAGAEVTMVQRSQTYIISEAGLGVLLKPFYNEGGPPTEDSDLAIASFPQRANLPYATKAYETICEMDKPLHDGLKKAGFLLDEESKGLFIKYYEKGGGHYINTGCSDLIVEGKVKLKAGHEVSHFESNGIRMADGTFLEADIVVLATGYKSMRESTRKILGSTIADKTGPVWGYDHEGEIQGVWRRSGHPGFWYMGGNFVLSRIYSQYLALQIKAMVEGIVKTI